MSLISLLVTLVVVGFLCWIVLQVPMPHPFPKIIIGVICIVMVLWVMQQLGLVTGIKLR